MVILSYPLQRTYRILLIIFYLVIFGGISQQSHADTAKEIDVSVNVALERFYNEVGGQARRYNDN